jgi:alpha-1,6-mannosyltransferase
LRLQPTASTPSLVSQSAVGERAALAPPPPPRLGLAGLLRAGEGGRTRRTPPVALALALVLVGSLGLIVIDGAAGKSPLLPPSPSMSKWLMGLGSSLEYHPFLISLIVFTCAYAGLIALSRRVSARVAIALVCALSALVLIAPIMISTDVFSYIAYARMAAHGVNPYLHGPVSLFSDPIYRYVGGDWLTATTAYGPLYTLISLPIAPLGLIASVWGMKVQALLSVAATLAFTWRCCRRLNVDPVPGLLVIGANPLWLIYGFGGAHNDLMMIALMMGAVTLTLDRREASAGASIVAGAFVKATAIALLPFIALSRRSGRLLAGAATAAVTCAGLGFALFGVHGADLFEVLTRDSSYVSSDGFPTEFAHLLGKPGIFPVDHTLLKVALALVVVYLMWRTWRGYSWVAASGWALLAIAVTSPWLLAWYTLWPLPLAVVSRERRLLVAVLAIQGLYVVHQLSPLFSVAAAKT